MQSDARSYRCTLCPAPEAGEIRWLEARRMNVCPNCGTLLPITVRSIERFFKIIHLRPELDGAKRLILKSEIVAGVRDALATFETIVREKSGLAATGSDLMAKAFSFETDKRGTALTQRPKIAVTQLSSVSERNEQEGVKFVAMGLMQGIRNIGISTCTPRVPDVSTSAFKS